MSALSRAIAEKRWELVALCLLLGLLEAMSELPPDAVVGLMDVIDGGDCG